MGRKLPLAELTAIDPKQLFLGAQPALSRQAFSEPNAATTSSMKCLSFAEGRRSKG